MRPGSAFYGSPEIKIITPTYNKLCLTTNFDKLVAITSEAWNPNQSSLSKGLQSAFESYRLRKQEGRTCLVSHGEAAHPWSLSCLRVWPLYASSDNGRIRFTTVTMNIVLTSQPERPKMEQKALPKMAVYGKVSVKMRQNRRRLSKLLLIVPPLFFGKV